MDAREYSARETLRDGTPVIVRAITPDDKSALQDGLGRLSPESAYYRFFYPKRRFSARELEYLTEIDFTNHVAVGAGVLHDDNTITPIGVGRYVAEATDSPIAEIAFAVADEYQGLGVGPILLEHLARIARRNGIRRFTATVLQDNTRMLRVFAQCPWPVRRAFSSGAVEITLSLD